MGFLSRSERRELEALARRPKSELRLHRRARMILLADDGESRAAIARRLGSTRYRVGVWIDRYLEGRIDALRDRPRSGRPRKINSLERHQVVATACQDPAKLGCAYALWTEVALAKALVASGRVDEISASSVGRILRAGDLKPHRIKMWCHSEDPEFQRKLADIVGLYLDPPRGEPVLCIDEKSGMQALSRKRGLIRPEPGRMGRLEFEYRRHGTSCLWGCFNVRTGCVLGRCTQGRTRAQFFEFMDLVASAYRQPRVHVVLDNLNIHKDTSRGRFVSDWNRRHGDRFVFHYTPTHGSWLNQIELWFGILARRILKYASFASTAKLDEAVLDFIEKWNEGEAHPFRWTYDGLPLVA